MSDTEHDISTLPGWLRELRRRQGWTQHETARRLTIARSTVARLETGVHKRPLPMLARLLAMLGAEVGLPPPPKD